MFLRKLYVENYRTLKKTEVVFEDGLNIIIGKNGVGKSNLLNFINNALNYQSVFGVYNIINNNYGYRFELFNERNRSKSYSFSIDYIKDENSDMLKRLAIERFTDGILVFEHKRLIALSSPIISPPETHDIQNQILQASMSLGTVSPRYLQYHIPKAIPWIETPQRFTSNDVGSLNFTFLNPTNITQSLENYVDNEFGEELGTVGNNFPVSHKSINNLLFNSFAKWIEKKDLINILKEYTTIENVRLTNNVNTYINDGADMIVDNLILEFFTNDAWLPWSFLSDGTKKLFFIISELVYNSRNLILIEEPELGIHPHQLYKLMDFIKEQSKTKQIIISTHSPLVLDCLESDELNRISIAKLKNGATVFEKLNEEETEKAKIYMRDTDNLSNYWLHSDLEGDDD